MATENSPYAMFGTNSKNEKKGINLDFGSFVIRIARAGGANKAYQKALMKYTKPHRKALSSGSMDPKVQTDLLVKVYAETVVLDWVNVVDAEGNPMDCTVDNVVKLFTDLPELFQQVVSDAENYRLFQEVDNEDIAKNS